LGEKGAPVPAKRTVIEGDNSAVLEHRRIIDSLAHGVIVTEPDGQIRLWSAGAEALFGWSEAEVLGRSLIDIVSVPEHVSVAHDRLLERASGVAGRADYVLRCRDGGMVSVRVASQPVLDERGDVAFIVSLSEDSGQLRRLERSESELIERLQLALDAGGLGTWHWDRTTGLVEWDQRLEELFGFAPGTFDGTYETWRGAIHPDDLALVQSTIDDAVEGRHGYSLEHRVVWPDGSVHWLAASGQLTQDASGEVTGTIGCVHDITAKVDADRVRDQLTAIAMVAADTERRHRIRLQYLADVNRVLNQSRSRAEVLANIPATAVPLAAAWSALYVLPGSDPDLIDLTPDVSVSTDDPALEGAARALESSLDNDPVLAADVAKVIQTGQSVVVTPDSEGGSSDGVLNEQGGTSGPAGGDVPIALRNSITVPLVKRGRVLGALQMVQHDDGRPYGDADLSVAEVAAARIASSLTNLRLIEHERHIATALQRALLPSEIPDIPGVDVAVRYWASGEGTEVGGDFYDVFSVDDHQWAAVVGDVCGKGPDAAAVTSVTRHSIRMSAWHGDRPVEVLEWLNRALLPLDPGRFCTAAYAVIRHDDAGITLTSTVGGHPLPLVFRADGPIEVLGSPGTLLGAFPTIAVSEATTRLRSGDVVVLYTDGITDVAPPHGFDGDDMAEFVSGCLVEGGSADDMAERMFEAITARLPIAQRVDDIALLVLRVA
jgi:PAS domain S-box-containing protein